MMRWAMVVATAGSAKTTEKPLHALLSLWIFSVGDNNNRKALHILKRCVDAAIGKRKICRETDQGLILEQHNILERQRGKTQEGAMNTGIQYYFIINIINNIIRGWDVCRVRKTVSEDHQQRRTNPLKKSVDCLEFLVHRKKYRHIVHSIAE